MPDGSTHDAPVSVGRCLTPELMDEPGLNPDLHRQALRGLRRINAISRTAPTLARALWAGGLFSRGGAPRVLDIASGGGDVTVVLQKKLTRLGGAVAVDGCDISETAVATGQARADAEGLPCRFFAHHATEGPLPEGYDAMVCSLFLHHLEEHAIVALLRRMREAAPLVVIDDLVRSRLGLWLAKLGTRVLSRSPIVHMDGPRSVAGALTPDELEDLAARAGLVGARVTRRFPERMLLTWSRS